jgi:TorA maturation chaperone TorD
MILRGEQVRVSAKTIGYGHPLDNERSVGGATNHPYPQPKDRATIRQAVTPARTQAAYTHLFVKHTQTQTHPHSSTHKTTHVENN